MSSLLKQYIVASVFNLSFDSQVDKNSKPKRVRVTPQPEPPIEFDEFLPQFGPSSLPHTFTHTQNSTSTPISSF